MSNSSQVLASDYSSTSMSILAQKIREVFSNNLPAPKLWFPDIYEWPAYGKDDVVDVIFFGDFFRKFLETGNWTFRNFRIWCLGSPAREFFIQMAGFPAEQVSVIPRHLLFPERASLHSLSSLADGPTNLVYAGRLTPSKRILTMLWSVYYLQTKWNLDVSLHLFGEYFIEEKFCQCPVSVNPYQEKVETLIQKLDWKKKPFLGGKVAVTEWLNKPYEHPLYYSLSVLPFEDFSVSIAQAQELGWPCVVSQWGAHRELTGNLLRLPFQLFENVSETEESAQREGALIADYMARKKFTREERSLEQFSLPAVTRLSQLDERRREFLETWGMDFQDIIRHSTDRLKQNPRWNQFLTEYFKCFIQR